MVLDQQSALQPSSVHEVSNGTYGNAKPLLKAGRAVKEPKISDGTASSHAELLKGLKQSPKQVNRHKNCTIYPHRCTEAP